MKIFVSVVLVLVAAFFVVYFAYRFLRELKKARIERSSRASDKPSHSINLKKPDNDK